MNHKQIVTGEKVTVSGMIIAHESHTAPTITGPRKGHLVTIWVPFGNHEPQEA